MPGILDSLSANTPQADALRQGLLQMGLALMQGKGNVGQIIGQAGQVGVKGMQEFQDRQFQQQMRDQQMADIARKRVMEGRQDKQYGQEQALAELPAQYARNATQMGNQAVLGQTGGLAPTMANAQIQSANAQPGYDYQGLIDKYRTMPGGFDRAMGLEQALKKDTTPIKLGAGEKLLAPGTYRELATNPKDAASDATGDIREFMFAQQRGEVPAGVTFTDWLRANKQAGATRVDVNTGKEGIANELKMRDDFRGEPIYKAHSEVKSAYSQIQQGLKMASPAGDLAAATKIMKLLDPGSVVRESELGMAMAATGLTDRIAGYASNILNGTKLNAKQREDFQALADALYGESVKQYNAKQGEYINFAGQWKLNGDRIVGKPEALPTTKKKPDAGVGAGWSIKPL